LRMLFRNRPIRQKLMAIILGVTGAALLFTCAAFATYEFFSFRRSTVENLAMLGSVIAANSTASLAFDNPADATEILSALRAEKHVTAAVIYTDGGRVFATYPSALDRRAIPRPVLESKDQVTPASVSTFRPIVASGHRLGTLYLEADLGAITERFRLLGTIAVAAIFGALVVAYVLSRKLQRQVSGPVVALAETARVISEQRDFSVRAVRFGDDELGRLTDAFNDMLGQLQERQRALRDSEARLRAVLNSALSAVVLTDDLGRILDWNARAEKMFERGRGEVLGADLATILRPEQDADGSRSGMKRYGAEANSSTAKWPQEMTALRRDGTEFPVEVAINPIVAGGTINFCSFITDITQRKQSEREIQTLNQQLAERIRQQVEKLENANKELESFSYSVSHDLRAPLRHIDGFTSMLTAHLGKQVDEKGKRYLSVINESARRMGRLIDDLLSFSRHGRVELKRTNVKLGDLVEEVRYQLQNEIAGRNIQWNIEPLPEVYGDVSMLRQVLANLLGNAVKYTRNRGEAVITIGSTPSPGREVIIFVRDNGAGFDPKYAGRLFGVFQRLHAESEFEGTGVGLANVQRILHRHGGRVWAEGKVDEGATFYFALPLPPQIAAAALDSGL